MGTEQLTPGQVIDMYKADTAKLKLHLAYLEKAVRSLQVHLTRMVFHSIHWYSPYMMGICFALSEMPSRRYLWIKITGMYIHVSASKVQRMNFL